MVSLILYDQCKFPRELTTIVIHYLSGEKAYWQKQLTNVLSVISLAIVNLETEYYTHPHCIEYRLWQRRLKYAFRHLYTGFVCPQCINGTYCYDECKGKLMLSDLFNIPLYRLKLVTNYVMTRSSVDGKWGISANSQIKRIKESKEEVRKTIQQGKEQLECFVDTLNVEETWRYHRLLAYEMISTERLEQYNVLACDVFNRLYEIR